MPNARPPLRPCTRTVVRVSLPGWVTALALVVVSACSGGGPSAGGDGGPDEPRADASGDGSSDAATDASSDGATDASTTDAATDASTDAATDGATDAGEDDAHVEPACAPDEPCDDGNACTGPGLCSSEGECVPGEPIDCVAVDACHTASCDPERGCVQALIDADDDGFASEELGPCGLDCDDADPYRHPDAEELCDGVDNNCDPDDEPVPVAWYADCDGDGHSAPTEPSVVGCEAPDEPPEGCSGENAGWTTSIEPADCCLTGRRFHPGSNAWIGNPAPPCGHYDANCDGEETLRYRRQNVSAGCVRGPGGFSACTYTEGWKNERPACGEEGTWYGCDYIRCLSKTRTQRQQCQ